METTGRLCEHMKAHVNHASNANMKHEGVIRSEPIKVASRVPPDLDLTPKGLLVGFHISRLWQNVFRSDTRVTAIQRQMEKFS